MPPEKANPPLHPPPQKKMKKEKRNRTGLRGKKKIWQRKLTDLTILWQI
jgi:hypothetical protein